MYEYTALVINVVDGDTVDVVVDLGFHIRQEMRVRLARIDAPERFTEEGKTSTEWLLAQLDKNGWFIMLRTIKDTKDKYGRYLGDLIDGDGESINDAMVEAGHAKVYGS